MPQSAAAPCRGHARALSPHAPLPPPPHTHTQGLTYFHDTIYAGLPVFLRRIDTALKNIGQPMLPLEARLFSFGAWMGGDRDGNPYVTPDTTRDVVIGARLRCAAPRAV